MRINKGTDFALRLLMYTASFNDSLATLAKVATFYGISHEHLRKVVHELGQAGILNTYRGRYGGFKLAKHPKEINIGDVILLFEGRTPIIDCVKLDCPITEACLLKGVLDEAEFNFINTLKQYSLADVLYDNQLERLQNIQLA